MPINHGINYLPINWLFGISAINSITHEQCCDSTLGCSPEFNKGLLTRFFCWWGGVFLLNSSQEGVFGRLAVEFHAIAFGMFGGKWPCDLNSLVRIVRNEGEVSQSPVVAWFPTNPLHRRPSTLNTLPTKPAVWEMVNPPMKSDHMYRNSSFLMVEFDVRPVYVGLSPLPVIVEMKVYRDSLLKM